MTLEQLLSSLREDRLDDCAEPHLWSDERLVEYLNDAVRQVCLRQRALIESVNPAVCRLPLLAGARFAKLHPAVLSVRSAHLVDDADPHYHVRMRGTTMRRAERECDRWRYSDDARPQWWIPDVQDGYLYFSGAPDRDCVLALNVWRTPLEDELLDPDDLDASPVIGEAWHADLLDWATYKAFDKKDAETIDVQRGGQALAMFDAKIGRLPSATEIRLWGVQKITGTRAQFL